MSRKVTYQDLEEVLLSLGFTKFTNNGHVRYREPHSGAIVALPVMPPEEPVIPRHYGYARAEVDGMGVIDRQDFEKLMEERGSPPSGLITVGS